MPVTFFPVTSPVSKTFEYLALVLRAHYAICRYMFTVGFQYNFRQITARFSAGRRKQLVVSDMLLFCCPWFEYRFIKLKASRNGILLLGPLMPNFLRHAQSTFFGKLLFSGIRGLNSLMFTFKLTQANCFKIATNFEQMGRNRVHGSHFSRSNQPSVKKKREITNENVKKIAASSVRVELKNLSSEEKIDKLERVYTYSVKVPA